MTIENTDQPKGMVQFAMEAGAYMGLFFVVKFIFTVLSLNFPICNIVATFMMLLIPVLLYFLLREYHRENRCRSHFSQLWMAGILLFFFASLIVALAQYVYYIYINPEYIHSQFVAAVNLMETMNLPADPSVMELLKEELAKGKSPDPMTVVMQQIWVNVFFGSLLSLFMSGIVRAFVKSEGKRTRF